MEPATGAIAAGTLQEAGKEIYRLSNEEISQMIAEKMKENERDKS